MPWQHTDAFDFLRDLQRHYKPDVVVNLGDEVDFHAFSRFPKTGDDISANEELGKARAAVARLAKVFPKQKVCLGNHTARLHKRLSEIGIPAAIIPSPPGVLDAPITWEYADTHEVDGVVYLHGDGFSGQNAALRAATAHRRKVVIGHVHAYAGIQYATGRYDSVWGMNVGCLIDPDASVFAYGKHYANRPTLGAGVVCDGVPYFIPMRA